MSSHRKPSGNIHKIREFELEKINLADEFDILQIVGEGWFGKILLVDHRGTDTEMVLKALPKPYVSLRDFYREFHYGLHLGVHKHIVTTYDIAFETAGFYVFTQEYAPLGDLTSNIMSSGIGELHSKRVAKQIASALDYIHSKDIVHRDVKLDNVLVFRTDFSRVKLCDFGESRRAGSIVQRRNEWLPYSPPEVLRIKTDDSYKAKVQHDIWQFGIVIFICLTGCLPWQKAANDDPRYFRYVAWHGSPLMMMPIKRTPKLFKLISNKACRMFRRLLEPNEEKRPAELTELHRFIEDRWLAKTAEKEMAEYEQDELCPSMYSFHSSPEEKDKLLSSIAQCGIEVTVDRVAKKNRIREWIQSSVIMEDDEEDEDSEQTPPASVVRMPVAGHISSIRAMEEKERHINTTLKDAANKHIDPRTGQIQVGPSEMGSNPATRSMDTSYKSLDRLTDTTSQQTLSNYSSNYLTSYDSVASIPEPMINGKLDISIKNGTTPKISQTLNLKFPSHDTNGNHSDPTLNNFKSDEQLSNRRYDNVASPQRNLKPCQKRIQKTTTSRGLMSAFNSVANITVPGSQYSKSTDHLTVHDSGYGSNERVKDSMYQKQTQHLISPTLLRRSVIKSSSNEIYKKSNQPPAPFDSDWDDDQTLGSTGFINHISSMKDTPYDRIKMKVKK